MAVVTTNDVQNINIYDNGLIQPPFWRGMNPILNKLAFFNNSSIIPPSHRSTQIHKQSSSTDIESPYIVYLGKMLIKRFIRGTFEGRFDSRAFQNYLDEFGFHINCGKLKHWQNVYAYCPPSRNTGRCHLLGNKVGYGSNFRKLRDSSLIKNQKYNLVKAAFFENAGTAMIDSIVIIPTYNEIDNIEAISKAVLAVDQRIDVLIVDDNSPDGTGAKADDLALQEPRIHVLHRHAKEGLGRAYLAGFEWALARSYRYIFEMDADFSHDPRYLPLFFKEMNAGADLVLGSRYVKGGGTVNWGFLRRIISRGGSFYARSILGIPIRDLTGGFKSFRRETLEGLDFKNIKSTGYSFQIELTYHAINHDLIVREIPIVFEDRRVGKSKMSKKAFLEAVTMVVRLRFSERLFKHE